MSLADHVRLRPDPQLQLAIELKYGKPVASAEYVYSLPLTVVKRMNDMIKVGMAGDDEDILRLNLQYAICYSQWASKLQEELFLYHSLLGRV